MQLPRAIKTFEYLPNFGDSISPARVNRVTGHLQINQSRWCKIKPAHRFFILLHENAHVELQSSDELAVDAKAFQDYIKAGYALTEAVFSLTKVLHSDSEQSRKRQWQQYTRAVEVNKLNKKQPYSNYQSLDGIDFNVLASAPNCVITDIQDSFDGEFIDVHYDSYDYPDIAAELNKVPTYSRKKQRKMKKSIRLYKRLGRSRKKYAVADDIKAGADTRMVYAKQGIYVPTRAESISKGIGSAIDKVTGLAGAITGSGGGSQDTESVETQQPNEPQQQSEPPTRGARLANPNGGGKPSAAATKTNKNIIVFGGVGLLVTAVIAYIILKK